MWRPPDPLDAVVVWRDQAEHAAESLTKGSRVVVLGRLQQRGLDRRGRQRPLDRGGRGRGAGASLRWAAATTRTTPSQDR